MPQMPEPTSVCPIFGRFEEKSKDPVWVEAAYEAMKTEDFVDAGETLGALSTSSCWDCGGTVYNEVDYLKKLWFDPAGWWDAKAKKNLRKDLNRTVKKALLLAKTYKIPIKGVWVCVEEKFDTRAEIAKPKKPPEAVWIVVETPAPPVECKEVPCP